MGINELFGYHGIMWQDPTFSNTYFFYMGKEDGSYIPCSILIDKDKINVFVDKKPISSSEVMCTLRYHNSLVLIDSHKLSKISSFLTDNMFPEGFNVKDLRCGDPSLLEKN